MRRQLNLLLLIAIIGVVILIGYYLATKRKEPQKQLFMGEGTYQIGEILVDTVKGEIKFSGDVYKREGWVQFLIYVDGYKWLKEESAIISTTRLVDLQKSIALLDWRLWDELWYRKLKSGKLRNKAQKLSVFIKYKEKEIAAKGLVLTEDELEIGDYIFLGSPYFDNRVLEDSPRVDCKHCPLFPLEEKVLREEFKRESGLSGYNLNSPIFLPRGTEVTIIIRQRIIRN